MRYVVQLNDERKTVSIDSDGVRYEEGPAMSAELGPVVDDDGGGAAPALFGVVGLPAAPSSPKPDRRPCGVTRPPGAAGPARCEPCTATTRAWRCGAE